MYRVLYLSLLYTGCLLLTTNMYGQQTALKTNLLFWATTTPNTDVEFGMGRQFTMDIWGAYNAWKYPDDMASESVPDTAGSPFLAVPQV